MTAPRVRAGQDPVTGINREAMEAKLADLATEQAKAVAGGGERYVARHHARGRLMPRERLELRTGCPRSP